MPYKSWESYKIEEECIEKWARDLKDTTAKTYVYYFLKYLDWVKKKGYWSSAQEMLDDFKSGDENRRYKHLDALLEYIKSCNTGVSDKQNKYQAVRSFYEYHRADLPKPSRQEANRVFTPSEMDKLRAIHNRPLKIEEVRKIIIHASQPYKAAYMVVLQGALGPAEYDLFNMVAWKNIVDKLDEEGPIKIDLVREKTSRQEVRWYYTFIGADAKELIKEWLKERPVNSDALFVVYNRQKREYVPLTSRLLGNMLTKIAKRLGLIEPIGPNGPHRRYHIHLHEFRDLFKSLCTLHGVNAVASEFFLGHAIDKLGYDKSPEYDVEWFRQEYMKVEPLLNILSNTGGEILEKAKEEVRKEFGELIVNLQKENYELRKQLERLEKVVKVIAKVAMEDPSLLPAMKEFLEA